MTQTDAGAPPEGALDPITFEVVRNKLAAIAAEQAITLRAASGSPVVTDATDFNNGIYLPDGSIVTMGRQVLFHSGSMRNVIKSVVEHCREQPGINPGDMFILNDPYRGAVHQPDVSVIAPIFHGGEHVAWAGSCAHQLDVGGMNFGSWSLKATDVQQEAMLLRGVKLVDGGELRQDLWDTIMGMTRLPMLVGLDLKAMIAANNVAIVRFTALMDRYGGDVVREVMAVDLDVSERRLRDRLRELPDGVYRATDFLEHDGHENRLYEIRLAVHKRGDALEFDFAGSSPQAPGFINCTYSGLTGAVYAAVLPILAPDIRWNEGIMRRITISAPEGTVVNARWPAPVSGATVSSIWVATNVSAAALARLAVLSPHTSGEAAAVTKGSMMVFTMAGADRDGSPYGTFLMDSMAGGGGAYADHDGLTACGDYCVPRPAISNVENAEAGGPLLYLYRRVLPDTGGPGRTRGGATVGLAVTPHGTDALHAMLITHGSEVPNSAGLFGGLEGATNEAWLLRGAGADAEPGTPARPPVDRIAGPEPLRAQGVELGPKPGFFDLVPGDVFGYSFQGGGGWGDPLEREPEAVRADLEAGLVTESGADALYGVVLRGGAVDEAATEERRAERRALRLAGAPRTPARAAPTASEHDAAAGPVLRLAGGRWRCRCGEDLGPAAGSYKDRAVTRTVSGPAHGAVTLHRDLELHEHACPACATLLESEVARRGAPSLHTIAIAAPDAAAGPDR